jgi:RNA polymerase sigma factor (TIGR02999 family)
MAEPPKDITKLLQDWSQGDPAALEKLIPLVFGELRQIAGRLFQHENDAHTLQPTALVNEAYFRLVEQRHVQWQNREQFFGVAGLIMRRILVDYGKRRRAAKRGSGMVMVPLNELIATPENGNVDYEALDQALTRLGEIDPRQSRIIEMHFLLGLTYEEIAKVLKVSVTTVKREWRTAKLWLYRELTKK